MSAIGNSGARSSGPTGWSVPGCSGGGGGEGRSGITLYHWRGISDSSSVILVRSATRPSDLQGNICPEPYSASRGDDPPIPPRSLGGSIPPDPLAPARGGIWPYSGPLALRSRGGHRTPAPLPLRSQWFPP